MVYTQYVYGSYKKEITRLLRLRETAMKRSVHHRKKLESWDERVSTLDREIADALALAQGKV